MAEAARASHGSPGVDAMAKGGCTGENFVERHRVELIKRVSNIKPILDELLRQKIISQYSYDQMKPLPTSQEKMTELFRWPLPVSGGEGKEMFYKLLEEHEPHLIDELRRTEEPVEAGMPVRELLLETLHHLRDKEIKKFNWLLLWKFSLCGFPRHLWHRLQSLHTAENLVDEMVQTWGQKSVEVTKEVLVDMNRTDLVQRLHTWGHKEEQSLGELWPELVPKVETMASAIELLLETLKDLTDGELEKFKDSFLRETQDQKITSDIRWLMSEATDVQDVVFVMVLIYGQRSVTYTMTFLENRIDLVQRLSHSSSEPQKKLSSEHRPALIQRAARKAAVRHLLWEIVQGFSDWEKILTLIISQNNPFSFMLRQTSDIVSVVDLMLQTFGLHSLDLTCEVLGIMGRSYTKCEVMVNCASLEEESTMTSVQESLLETLEDLNDEDLKKFKHHLQSFLRQRLEPANRVEMVKLMMDTYDKQSVELTRLGLKRMYWEDLHERGLGTIFQPIRATRIVGPDCVSESSDSEEGGSPMQESSKWTKLDPEVKSQDADDAPTYSLQSEAGNYECSVSGLRWICNGKVRFKYQFCPWEEPMERMESLQYMPAGPLMDITVVTGKLDEVYLPHWICIDDNPEILDKFAVLHIDDCGDDVEKVSQVTASHVKLSEPVFSPRAVLLRIGIPVRINCNVLLYKTNTAFLTLHVYLIPRDPGLQQEMDRRQISDGYQVIKKPHPNTSLKMNDRFILNAVLKGAEIIPENLKLRCDSRSPNFFEVYSKNPDTDFELVLNHKKDHQTVWNCTIRKDEYDSRQTHAATPPAGAVGLNTTAQDESDFVDEHRAALIDRVNNVEAILDDLLAEGVVSQAKYDEIMAISTSRDRMRSLFSGPLNAAGRDGKEVFYKILQRREKFLMKDLQKKK